MFPVISATFYLCSSLLRSPGNDCAPLKFKIALRTQDFLQKSHKCSSLVSERLRNNTTLSRSLERLYIPTPVKEPFALGSPNMWSHARLLVLTCTHLKPHSVHVILSYVMRHEKDAEAPLRKDRVVHGQWKLDKIIPTLNSAPCSKIRSTTKDKGAWGFPINTPVNAEAAPCS